MTEESSVEVAFDMPRSSLFIGEQAEVRIHTLSRQAVLSVPVTALVFSGKSTGVWIVQNGRLHFRTLTTGIIDPKGLVEVLSGLSSGELVVVEKAKQMARFKDGKRVRVQQ